MHTSNNSDDEKMVPRNPSTTLRATLLEQQLLGPRDSQKYQEIQPVGDSAKSATAEKVDPTPEFARQTTATALPNPNVSYWSKRSASSSGIGSPTGSPSKWKTVKDWFRCTKFNFTIDFWKNILNCRFVFEVSIRIPKCLM